jgi:hypothetical protein
MTKSSEYLNNTRTLRPWNSSLVQIWMIQHERVFMGNILYNMWGFIKVKIEKLFLFLTIRLKIYNEIMTDNSLLRFQDNNQQNQLCKIRMESSNSNFEKYSEILQNSFCQVVF